MAVFLVVMVLTIISAIGVYSARSASQVDLASGNARHAIQAQYAAEFAMRALAADMATGPDVYRKSLAGEIGERGNCRFEHSSTCSRKETGDILVNVLDPNLPGGLLGALSPEGLEALGGGTAGSFTIEMDDLGSVAGGLAGFDQVHTYEITVLAVGQIMPSGAPAGSCSSAFTMASGLQRIRGQISFGPFPE